MANFDPDVFIVVSRVSKVESKHFAHELEKGSITDFGNEEDKKNTVSFPGEPGTFLIHNAKTIHWAEGNKSQTRTRKALGFIYYGESAEINQEAHDAYQEKLRKEMKEKNLI